MPNGIEMIRAERERQITQGAESFQASETLAEVTCRHCLKAAKIFGEGAATRLQHLESSK
jgi:hypothetical protein